jgi:hypothetical protein
MTDQRFTSAILSAVLVLAITIAASADDRPAHLVIKPEAHKTLVNPQCSHCVDEAKKRADLRADDRALCWIRGYSDGGVIPYRFFLSTYRVISDTYGVFVFDPDAAFARGFAPSLDFTFHGWRNGVMVMKHKDGTLYSCLSGVGFEGPGKGTRLDPVPSLVSDWGAWTERYPQAVAYRMVERFGPVELPREDQRDSVRTRLPVDGRLEENAIVLGVMVGGKPAAYPLRADARTSLTNDTTDGKTCVVLWYAPTRTAAAYLPVASPPRKFSPPGRPHPPLPKDMPSSRAVTLEIDDDGSAAPYRDRETGTRWDVGGRGVSGELKGWTLEWVDSVQVKWFAWATEHPQTRIADR